MSEGTKQYITHKVNRVLKLWRAKNIGIQLTMDDFIDDLEFKLFESIPQIIEDARDNKKYHLMLDPSKILVRS